MNLRLGWKLTPTLTPGAGGELFRALQKEVAAGVPPVVMAIDDPGWLVTVQQMTAGTPVEQDTLLHFRLTGNFNDVPEYALAPIEAARRSWEWHSTRWPKELDRSRVWFGITNEPDRERHDWLARYSLELCKLALAAGVRLSVLGWSAGTPEPEAWHTAAATELLRLLRANPTRLALELHEYSLVPEYLQAPPYEPAQAINGLPGSPTVPWLLGRYTYIPEPLPSIIISEFGWAYNDAPVAWDGLPQLLKAAEQVYNRPEILGLAIWTLGRGKSWEGLPAKMVPYIAPLSAARAAPVGKPPTTPPTAPIELLDNPSFEEGWKDISQSTQQPNGWRFAYNGGVSPVSGQPYGEPEGVHKSAQQLPADEAARYIRDGQWCYKLFAGLRPFWARLVQEWAYVPEGRYTFTWRGWVDFYRVTDKKRDYAVETNSARYMLKVNDTAVAGPVDLIPANATGPVYREVTTVFTHKGGPLKLAVHMSAEWGISNNFFLDDWSFKQAVTEPEPPVEPPPVEPPTPDEAAVGIDVSKWQGTIDWVKAAAKADFAFIRASYGKNRDERVDEYAPGALATGLPYGLYHYLHFFDSLDAQVDTFAAVIEAHGLDLPPVVDLEDNNFNGLTVTQRAAFVLEFMEMLQERLDRMDIVASPAAAAGTKVVPVYPLGLEIELRPGLNRLPIIYTNYSYWRSSLGAPKWGSAFDLWIANWTQRDTPLVPEPWASGPGWKFWQYANNGRGPDYGAQSERIDLNRFNGTTADLQAYLIPRGVPEPKPPTLAEQIWTLGTAAPGIANTPIFALQAAMHEDGLYPLTDEFRATIDGERYAYRRAGGIQGQTLVYYAPVEDWDAVRVVGPEDALPEPPVEPQPPVEPPAPPTADKIDLLPFMTGKLADNGRGPLFEMRHSSGNQARHQTQVDENRVGWYYLTKGNELSAEWEHFGADDNFIYRGRDTSPGGDRMYTLYDTMGIYGSAWIPRRMAVGETFKRNPIVRWQRIADCALLEEQRQFSTIRLAEHKKNVNINGISVGDCIVLEWLRPDGGTEETWTFSALYGLVEWSNAHGDSSAISEVHAPGARPDNRRQVVRCPLV